ncbi:hypothetical protein SLEP1_g3671 [Rubroshorea leprosula]|uniref:Uncharacterized protein n=1 Tax=Rubroshorea leprosula TaxID=152421 RepID=A0AAV5HWZ5_9ROSI|nr:hypothetical protein SLEP1_g3671 [Rubroshorea leprosula]
MESRDLSTLVTPITTTTFFLGRQGIKVSSLSHGSSSATSMSKMDEVSEVAKMPDLGLRKEEEGRRERKKE